MEGEVSRGRAWLMAIRPQTLPAGIAPVLVGTAFAYEADVLAWPPAVAALVGALLIQIGTNFANDYYDARRGVDTDERDGFTRVTQSGLLPGRRVRSAMVGSFLAALLVGGYLVWIGGLPIVFVGLCSIVCGITYAGGPFPFGSYGLGDLFVFVFFGLVAVTGTYYVQAAAVLADPIPLGIPPGTISTDVVIGSLAIAALATGILVVNNFRDIDTDARAGKRTLAVLIGVRYTRVEFLLLLGLAYVVPPALVARSWPPVTLLPLASLPMAVVVLRPMLRETPGPRMNRVLERMGQLLLLYAVLFSVGVVLA